MTILIKEYQIPFFGKLTFLDDNGSYLQSVRGKYYSINNGEVFIIKCNSLDELTEKTAYKVKNFLSTELIVKKAELEKLERTLKEVDNLNNLEDYKEWLKQYQTHNSLQLEFQGKNMEFMGDDQ
jgi:hypothetical protein